MSIRDVAQDAPGIKEAFHYPGEDGVIVHELLDNAPVAGKLQKGDIITEMNGKPVKTVQELRNTIAATPPGSELKLKVFRDQKFHDVSIHIGEQPENLETVSLRGNRVGPSIGSGKQATPYHGRTAAFPGPLIVVHPGHGAFTWSARLKFGLLHAKPVKPRSAAFKAGLRPGDVVTEVAGKPVNNAKEAADAIAKQEPGRTLLLYVSSSTAGGSRFVFVEPQK